MGLFDGIGDAAANFGNAVLPGSPFDRNPPPRRGHPFVLSAKPVGRGPKGRLRHETRGAGELFYPQESKPLPPKTQKRLVQIWDEQIGGKRPYFRMANKSLGGTDAYFVRAKGGTPVIVFDPQQARDLMRVPNDVNGQYAVATALHEMAHASQTGIPESRREPGAELFSQLSYPGIQQDLDRYTPTPAQRQQMWKWRAYPDMTNAMIRRYYGSGYGGEYLPPKVWGGPSGLHNLTGWLQQEQFGFPLDYSLKEGYAQPLKSARPYSANFPGRNPWQASPPKTPWDKLRWQQGY